MGQTHTDSWQEHGHPAAARKPDTEPPVKSRIDFLLALSIGSMAFGALLLVLVLVYLLHGMSVETLAIWICCVVAAVLMMLGRGLFLLTKGTSSRTEGRW